MDKDFYVSAPTGIAPKEFKTPLQAKVYGLLESLGVDYERVDCQPAVTMDDCQYIDAALGMHTVKTILLCNRQQTKYYLLVMRGDKPFVTRDFGAALGVSRVSFAPAATLLSKMETEVGAATLFSLMLPTAADVRLVFDKDVFDQQYYGGTDGTTTGYFKCSTMDLTTKILPAIHPQPFDTITL